MFRYLLQEYKASFRGLPLPAWTLALVAFINRSGSMVLFFLTLYLTTQKNFTPGHAGQMISLYGLGAMAGSFVGGRLSDRLGAVRVQMLSFLLSGIGFIVLGYLDNTIAISIFLFFLAVISESSRPAIITAMAEACPPERRSRGMALNRLAINFGMAIGPALGGFLATINYIYLFWADGITWLAAAFVLFIFFGKQTHLYTAKTTETHFPLRSPYKDKVFLFSLFLLLCLGLLFTQIFSTWPLYLKDIYMLQENHIGLLMGFNAILVTLVEMPLVYRMERRDSVKIMSWGVLFLYAGFVILPLGNSLSFSFFTVLIWTIGEMLIFPLFSAWVANRAVDANRGQYMGMFTFIFALSFVLGPYLGTHIYEWFGPTYLWYGFGLVGIIVALGFRNLHKLLFKELSKST